MKKNTLFYTMLTGAAVLSTVGAVNAFAEDTALATPISAEVAAEDTAVAESQYTIVSGTVSSLTKEDTYTRIEITNDDMGMVFTVQDNDFECNRQDGDLITLQYIK